MNTKNYLLLLIFCLLTIPSSLKSQSLPVPRDITEAYKKGTRSYDGKPGVNYWQNHSYYKIDAKLLTIEKRLQGKLSVQYKNNSPDSLTEIVMRLYPDFFRKGAVRNFSVHPNSVTDGVKIGGISINGKALTLEEKSRYRQDDTHLYLYPEEAVKSGGSVTIAVEWEFSIPTVSQVRMGAYDSTTFFIALWYPQIAVYDDVFGWDKLIYNGETEYYNDFSDYEVVIDVPSDFTVWATGKQSNSDEILSSEIKNRLHTATASDSVVNIIDSAMIKSGLIYPGDNGRTKWKFTASYVPDFAFGAAKNYLWDATSLKVEGRSFERVLISAAYNPKSKDFYEVAYFSRQAINKFSNVLPGVAFPYPYMTVFNGSGGMEFPMMVNNGSSSSRAGAAGLAAHEIAHTYFPFYMGINEKRYAWMDEGWAVFLPFEYQLEAFPDVDPRIRNAKGFAVIAGTDFEVPLNVSTYHSRGSAYRNSAYSRPANAYYFLRDALGNDKFDAALKEYIRRWNGKHPLPYDFFFTFEDYMKEDLSWYWKPWFFSTAFPDVAIESAERESDKIRLSIKNIGKLPLPVTVKLFDKDNNSVVFNFSPVIWKSDNSRAQIEIKPKMKAVSVLIGESHVPDIDLNNNFYQFK